jgi:hypothetical protein|tara:strand:- start:101 stop:526 length:426 start_codon:yes stop_codon:yes gene_type:complete
MAKEKTYDWVDRSLFLMIAYAHFTDWDLADAERALIKSKTHYFLKEVHGGDHQYSSEDIESKMCIAYDWWNETQNQSIDEVLAQFQDAAGLIKNQAWFNSVVAQTMVDFLAELAESDGVIIDNEKYSLRDLADFWGVESRL